MHSVIIPDNMRGIVSACFTGKNPGSDLEMIAAIFRTAKDHIYMPIQKHTDRVMVIGSLPEPFIADAVVTNQKGRLIGVRVADCVPILLCDPVRQVVAAVHAGWRGTAEYILKKTINVFCERFFSDPDDILLSIGPSIRQCCYEVDGEVIRAVSTATGDGVYYGGRGDKFWLDLALANRLQALSAGLSEGNVWMSDDCTFCNPEKFYSYRFSKGTTGRQAGFIGLL